VCTSRALGTVVSQPLLQDGKWTNSFHLMAPQMLSALVTFDIENETRAVRPSLFPAIEALFDNPPPQSYDPYCAMCV
jgi:hypothetical protein